MANLKSRVFSVTDSEVLSRSAVNAKSLSPLSGDIRMWYGAFTGTAAELKAQGMLIPSGALMEHIYIHTGTISIVAVTGTVLIHEVI